MDGRRRVFYLLQQQGGSLLAKRIVTVAVFLFKVGGGEQFQ